MSKSLDALRRIGEADQRIAEEHADGASHAHALARLHEGEIAKHFKGLGNALEVSAREHANRGADILEACDKGMDTSDLNKLRSDQVRSVIPVSPIPYGSAVVTAIPRAGQPPMGTRADVAEEFQHLVKTSDDE